MIRVVLDTVIYVRALINPRSACGRIVFELSEHYVELMSNATATEFYEVVGRPELRRRFPHIGDPPHIDAVLELLTGAEVLPPPPPVTVCRDPDDDKFFACAITGGADYIVSEDQDILAIAEYEGVRTITAADFIALLSRDLR